MPPRITCDCGSCKRCGRRESMRRRRAMEAVKRERNRHVSEKLMSRRKPEPPVRLRLTPDDVFVSQGSWM